MKLIFLITLLSFTIANANILSTHAPTLNSSSFLKSAHSKINEYFTALYAQLNLSQPTQLLKCFDDQTAYLYFLGVVELSDLSQQLEDRKRVKVSLDLLLLNINNKVLNSTLACVNNTQDYRNLLNAAGLNVIPVHSDYFNTTLKGILISYFQARYGKLAQELPLIVNAFYNQDFTKAGKLAATAIQTFEADLKNNGAGGFLFGGVWNGINIDLGLPNVESASKCFNKTESFGVYERFYLLPFLVAPGGEKAALRGVWAWWYYWLQLSGYTVTSQSAWDCWTNSTDVQAVHHKLQVDFTNDQFIHYNLTNYAQHQAHAFYNYMVAIHNQLDSYDLLTAGATTVELLKAVAVSNLK